MHNLFDDIEDLSVQKSNLPKIPTVESSEEAQKIENDRKQIRENAYQTILVLYQQRNVVEKQWKKVSTKDDDYDNKFNQYIAQKQEIEKLSDIAKDLFDHASTIDENTIKRVQTLRDKLGIMRFRPMLTQKNNNQEQKWIWPCKGEIVGEYGEQRTTHIHNGIDIKVPVGTPVKAIADGTVVVVGPSEGYGYWVGINHGLVNGTKVSSEYGHLSKWIVNNGQKVKQGQIIGYSGNTGYSFGPHLHLTIRHGNPGKGGGKAVNPWIYIDRKKLM